MPAPADASPARIKDVNVRYHDVAAADYDAKWGIDFGPIGRDQVETKLSKALAPDEPRFGDALEIGAGTGYFSLNLLASGSIAAATCTDISPGMLARLEDNADRLGLVVETVGAEAEELPFADRSFDLVFGHAVLHHVPDLDRAASELFRVLRPGGTAVFCGEPSAYGDRLAAVPKRVGGLAAPLWRALVRAPRATGAPGGDAGASAEHELEPEVDVHAFRPGELRAPFEASGFDRVRIRGEELVANLYGWGIRTLEATAAPDGVPTAWQRFAFHSYLALQGLDARLLEPRLPPALFYNLMIAARRPR